LKEKSEVSNRKRNMLRFTKTVLAGLTVAVLMPGSLIAEQPKSNVEEIIIVALRRIL
jgi:hypothetical protein